MSNVFDLLEEIQHRVPELRTVLAGRAPLKLPGYSVNEKQLPPFDVESGQAFLRKQGVDNDLLAIRIVEQVGGSPLTLKLAARLVRIAQEDVGPGKMKSFETSLFDRMLGESIDAQLYYRILDHIHEPQLRKLAHPGLVLRRITADLIRRVLAGPCGVEVKDDTAADDLFRRLSEEVALVDSIDPKVLEHRSDVREIMLPLIKKKDEQQARRINEAAIQYYAERNEVVDRGEELYHRLLFDDFDRAEIEPRIVPEALFFVQRSIADLPDRSKAFLAARTSTECADAVWKKADLEDWELHAAQTAVEFLEMKNPAAALSTLNERSARSRASSLYAIEIDALLAAKRINEADDRSKNFLRLANDLGEPELLLDALLRRARVGALLPSPPPISVFVSPVTSLLSYQREDPRWSEFLSLLSYKDVESIKQIQNWRATFGGASLQEGRSSTGTSKPRRPDKRSRRLK